MITTTTQHTRLAVGDRVRYVGGLTSFYDGHIGIVSSVGASSVRVSWPTIADQHLGVMAFAFDEIHREEHPR